MIDSTNIGSLQGAKVVGPDGDKIGTVGQVYLDGSDGHPAWVTVSTGLFGTSQSFIPIDDAQFDGENLTVPYDKAFVKDAPRVDDDGALDADDEQKLYSYYGSDGVDYTRSGAADSADAEAGAGLADAGTGRDTTTGTDFENSTGHDTSGPNTDSAMTRSEERLNVGTETVEAGRARLRKYITTEQQTVNVPVSHEEVRLEREPITDANAGQALDGPALSEEEHEVVLTEERPVVEKEAVPVERVRLDTETVSETEQVTEDVRKEQIELEDGTPGTPGTPAR